MTTQEKINCINLHLFGIKLISLEEKNYIKKVNHHNLYFGKNNFYINEINKLKKELRLEKIKLLKNEL